MWQKLKAWVQWAVGWSHESGTIVWARIQVYLGIFLGVLVTVDLSPFFTFNPKLMIAYMIVNGMLIEMIRRRKGSQDPIG